MRVLLYFLFIMLPMSNVYSSIYSSWNDHDRQNEYPNNVDETSIVHKYDFDNPDMVFNPARKQYYDTDTKDDIDYDTFEENENPRNFARDFPDWLSYNKNDSAGVCDTKTCHEAANEIYSNIDPTVNPCDDFDKFACGGWRKHNPIPETSPEWSPFRKTRGSEQEIIRDQIQRQANSAVDSSAFLVYNWYCSCMNMEEIHKQGVLPLTRVIDNFGSCPLLNPFWFPFGWSLVNHLVGLNRFMAIHPFFLVTPGNDLFNSNQVLLKVSPADLILRSIAFYLRPGAYYDGVRVAYINLMVDVMRELSLLRLNDAYFLQQIKSVYRLELLLAKAKLSAKYYTYQKMTLRKLQREIPEFPWRKYIEALYSKIPQKKPITGNEIIAVENIYVLRKIAIIIRLTCRSTLANYLVLNIGIRFTDDLTQKLAASHHRFVVAMYGEQKRKERWRECVSSTNHALSMAAGRLFVEEKFNEDSKRQVASIFEDIRQQIINDFENISWMDEKTTTNAKEKAEAMLKNIGYPKFILNETQVRRYYRGMSFDSKNFLMNKLRRRLVLSFNTLYSREIKPNRGSWSMAPQSINAYYTSSYNKIVILAGILQSPFWKEGYPLSMQYGGIGFIIGHEISHGFDNKGMNFDKNGNYHIWASDTSSAAFSEKSGCLVDQYSNYKIFGQNINGKSTLGENIADNGGVKLAFKAYQDWLKHNGQDKTLPGLSFENNQLFFLKGAQLWCSNIRRTSTLRNIATDVHTPKMYRTIGPFSNFNEFSKAFNCPSNSKMNPSKKCSVW